MDTSKEYIKMCEMATKIQKSWNPTEGDFLLIDKIICIFVNQYSNIAFYYPAFINDNSIQIMHGYNDEYSSTGKDIVWLPRQDQLQDMIGIKCLNDILKIFEFIPSGNLDLDCSRWETETQVVDFKDYIFTKSLEQFWLVLIMKEKYNKKWNGKEWIL